MRRTRWAVAVYVLATAAGLALVLSRPAHPQRALRVTAPLGVRGGAAQRPAAIPTQRPAQPWAVVPLRLPARPWLRQVVDGASRVLGGFAAKPLAAVEAAFPGLGQPGRPPVVHRLASVNRVTRGSVHT